MTDAGPLWVALAVLAAVVVICFLAAAHAEKPERLPDSSFDL